MPSPQPDDIAAIMVMKAAQRHAGPAIDAMKAIATALKERSLALFEAALKEHKKGGLACGLGVLGPGR